MTKVDQPPPEAVLVEVARKALPRSHSAVSKVAKLAGISESRWRQIAKGYQQATKDTRVPVRAPADTLARMAKAVGIAPEQLLEVGREDAAEELVRQMTVRERVEYDRAGGQVTAKVPGLGAGLASLIPTNDPEPEPSRLNVEQEIVAQTWQEAHDLTTAVLALEAPTEELRDVTRRIIFTLSAYLIIRILTGRHAAQMEKWLQRIYTEREQLYRAVTIGEPKFPWLTDEEIAAEASSSDESKLGSAGEDVDAAFEGGIGEFDVDCGDNKGQQTGRP